MKRVLFLAVMLTLPFAADAAEKRSCMFPGEVATVRSDGTVWCAKPVVIGKRVVGKHKLRKVRLAVKRG